ncbi:MAG: peptidoglycan DD-metalloendopeptidase family protein [Chloroflexota bacterium]
MAAPYRFLRWSWWVCLAALCVLLIACAERADPRNCPIQRPVDINGLAPYGDGDQGPFRFPLEDLSAGQRRPSAPFQDSGLETPSRREYHAAEDFLSPPGTPVYAIADGRVSYSGTRQGYGWLVIVDHPQANLYSLYGHLSPSRWQIDGGSEVQQGDLLGYLGDPDENGGSAEQPLRPHLHLGLRAGQRADYPAAGEWRWMAGWITPCPSDAGWLQPSAIMTAQTIPAGGFSRPGGAFFEIWAVELILAGLYLIIGITVVIYGLRQDKIINILVWGVLMLVAGFFLTGRGFRFGPLLFVLAAILLALGVFKLVGRSRKARKLIRADSEDG